MDSLSLHTQQSRGEECATLIATKAEKFLGDAAASRMSESAMLVPRREA
jgi:hypothetical protein